MNEDKELEEAIQWLNDFTNIIAINKQYTITEGRLTKVQEAIEKVLKALENKDKEIYKLKQSNAEKAFRINEQYIPKKKIEDVKNKYETKYKKHKEVSDKQLEEVRNKRLFRE